ncbi:MAG TPA: prepilin-type N-terminal cleavage/methylation domain-containing protein [Terriglobia bacterium]|nr:prepilin-type N-terminal cleavage/methylation domain-containing protein [Terriglobia bacterium]
MDGINERTQGFSLLELLIVVAIILIIATIAIPSFLKSRQSANETAAIANLRTLSNAQATYSVSNGGQYTTLGGLVSYQLLDQRFATGTLNGYTIAVAASAYDYTAVATPATPNSGRYGYYLVPDGVVRYSTAASLAPAGKSGNPVN